MPLIWSKLILVLAVLLAIATNAAETDTETTSESKWSFSWANDALAKPSYGHLAFAYSKEYIEKHQNLFMEQLIGEMKGLTLSDIYVEH